MSDEHASFRSQPSIALRCERSFLDEFVELRAALSASEPWVIDWLRTLERRDSLGAGATVRLPKPRSVATYAELPFFRPPASHRCFYYSPPPSRTVIALKGLEPTADDFDSLLADLQRACYSPHDIAEHLVFEEHKIPGCLSLHEGIKEAERAAQLQLAHLRAYGTLARLPTPLFLLRHDDAVVERVAERLACTLSGPAFESVEPTLRAGLVSYVYYYPSTPVRVRELDMLLQGRDFRSRALSLLQLIDDPEQLLQAWFALFARLLWLGFLPASLASWRTGACCQPQNACIDGGFVDLDSVTPLGELHSDTAVYAGLQRSTDTLLQSVRALIAGSSDSARDESVGNRVDLHALGQYLEAQLSRALAAEARPGLTLDPRIGRYFTPAPSFADLVERLSAYYSPRSELDAAARGYLEFGLSRMAALKRP